MFRRFAKRFAIGLARRFSNGWKLSVDAFSLVRQFPKLIIFPFVSSLAIILLISLVIFGCSNSFDYVPIPGLDNKYRITNLNIILIISYLISAYFGLIFISVFFNAALSAVVVQRHETGRVSLRAGLSLAWKRLPQVLGWTFCVGTIGVLFMVLERWLKTISRWLVTFFVEILGFSWAALSFFVLPTLVVEGGGPFGSLRRAINLLKQRKTKGGGVEFSLNMVLAPLDTIGVIVVFYASYYAYKNYFDIFYVINLLFVF